MTSKLLNSFLSADDDSYAEDEFEQMDSFGGGGESNKVSPQKSNEGSNTKKSFEINNAQKIDERLNNPHGNPEKMEHLKKSGQEEEEEEEMSGDLEKYIMEMKIHTDPLQDENDETNDGGVDISKVAQRLEGIKPSTQNKEHQQLGEKLGYHERPPTNLVQPTHTAHPSQQKFYPSPHVNSQTISQKNGNQSSPPTTNSRNSKDEEDMIVNEAQKVESLLMELFPDKYGKKKLPKSKRIAGKPQQLGSIGGTKLGLFLEEEDATDPAKDVLSTLDGQLKLLKKELKVKDEKIAKLTEHSMMIANHMDRLKGELAKLHAKLRDAEQELEAKEVRLAEALKAKKKAKKVSQKSSPNHEKSFASLEVENIRLREREQALLQAVEELSSQNEDLIIKLRESMQRELELSSKRAALVSNSVMNHAANGTSLPNIHDHQTLSDEIRTQSEPSSDAPIKRGKKKGRASST